MTALNQARPNREDMTWGAEGDLGGYMLTPQELEAATAKSDLSGYSLYTADQLSQQEIESATAEYHMEKDMSAMAHKIDLLLAENDQLKRQIAEMATTAQITDSYKDSLESAVRRLGGNAYKNVG